MDDPNRRRYPGEEHFYNRDKIRDRRQPGKSLLVGSFTVIGILVVILIIMTTILIHFVSASQTNSPTNTIVLGTTVSPVPATPIQPSSTSAPAIPTATPTTAPSTPTVGAILCQADWSSGLNGWTGTTDWKTLNGMLINDGTNGGGQDPPTLLAPCDLNSTPNYRVEVKVQVQSQGSDPGFGFYVRFRPDGNSGYMVGLTTAYGGCGSICAVSIAPAADFRAPMQNINFDPGTAVRTYAIEVKDNHIRVFIDGGFVTDVTDNRSLAGGSVGFWDKDVQLTISSFKVTSL